MELFDFLGDPVTSQYASRHDDVPRLMLYSEHAAGRLAAELRHETAGRQAIAVFDSRTLPAAGVACLQALREAGWRCHECLVPDRPGGGIPVCDEETKGVLQASLPTADVYVAIGSGVVNDLTKWLAADAGLPYAVLATAASMNGYAAANVAPTIRGVKSLFRAQAPRIVAAIPSVLQNAPPTLTSSGLGDVIAKSVSSADWLLNHLLFGEVYSPAIAGIVDRIEPQYSDNPGALSRGDPKAIRALFEALVLSGCAMTLQGSSLPASGGEHLVSHALDMLAFVQGKDHDLHGRQVGVGTIFAAALYERILGIELPNPRVAAPPFEACVWGGIADAVRSEHSQKVQNVEQACRILAEPGTWEHVRAALKPSMRSPQTIKSCLAQAGAAHRLRDIGCSPDHFLEVVRHCGEIRKRFTSIDLAWCLGVLPDAAEPIMRTLLCE